MADRLTYPTKTNNPLDTDSIRKYFATEANEVKAVIDNHATLIEILQQQVNLSNSKYYGTYTSLALLVGAHPTAAVGGYAIIDNGVLAQLAIWDNVLQVWELKVSKELVLIYQNKNDLPITGISGVLYLIRDSKSIAIFDGGQYQLYGGVDFTINGSGPDGDGNYTVTSGDYKIDIQEPTGTDDPDYKKLIQSGGFSKLIHKVAFTGLLSDLNPLLTKDLNINQSGHSVNLTNGAVSIGGQMPDNEFAYITIDATGQILLLSTKVIFFQGKTNFNGVIEYSSNLHAFFNERSMVDVSYQRLASAHNNYNSLRYITTTGDIETALQASSGDYFLIKKNTKHYLAVRKTNNLHPELCDLTVAGDQVSNRVALTINDPVLNTTASTLSYRLYDVAPFGTLNLPVDSPVLFNFHRKKPARLVGREIHFTDNKKIQIPNLDINLNNVGWSPMIKYLNPDNTVYSNFTNGLGFGSRHEVGAMQFCFLKFDNVTTGAVPDPDALLFIDELPVIPVAATGYPGTVTIRIMQDGATTPGWSSEGWTGVMSGGSDRITFYDNINRKPVRGLVMVNATIHIHVIYLSGNI